MNWEKEAIEKLIGDERGFRIFFEGAPDGMLLFDTTGRIIEFNDAAHRQLGYSRREFAGLDIRDIDPFESDEGMQAKVRTLMSEGKAKFEARQKTKDGDLRDIYVDTHVVRLSGRPVLYSIWRDVTDLKSSTESLGNAIKHIDGEKIEAGAVVAAMGNAVGMLGRDFKVLYQNPISIGLVGNHVGKYCYSAIEGKNTICEGCPVAASFKDGKIHTVVRRTQTDRGVLYWENTASVVRDSEGMIVAAVEVCRDVTQQKRAEDELLQRLNAFVRPAEKLFSSMKKDYGTGSYQSSSISRPFGITMERSREIPPLLNLSRREYQILCMIGSGKRTKEIAKELSIHPKTVSTYRSRIHIKLNLKSSAELIRFVIENNLADWTCNDITAKGE